MASLHARHSRKCALDGQWTGVGADGCTCQPTYYVAARDDGRLVRERVGRDKQDAQRAQRKIGTKEDEGTYTAQKNVAFDKWGERWLSALERKRTTINDYQSTIGYAVEVFGSKLVRKLTVEDVARFNKHLSGRMSASTRAKHLRVLGACLSSAVEHKYAGTNPVSELPGSEKPRAGAKGGRVLRGPTPAKADPPELTPGMFRTLFLTALGTGMRQGELAAARWGDVDLTAAVIRVRRTHTHGLVQEPKNRERRDVDLPPETVKLLGEWWGELGSPSDDTLVFPRRPRLPVLPAPFCDASFTRQWSAPASRASARPARSGRFTRLPTHVRSDRARERRRVDVGVPACRAFVRGHHGQGLRPLVADCA